MKAYVEHRRQKAKGRWPKLGPDTYVAVQVVPEGITKLQYLNKVVAKKRGIQIIYCGEGYSNRTSEKSMYSQALKKAKEIADKINERV